MPISCEQPTQDRRRRFSVPLDFYDDLELADLSISELIAIYDAAEAALDAYQAIANQPRAERDCVLNVLTMEEERNGRLCERVAREIERRPAEVESIPRLLFLARLAVEFQDLNEGIEHLWALKSIKAEGRNRTNKLCGA